MRPQVAMTNTLRKRSGARFISEIQTRDRQYEPDGKAISRLSCPPDRISLTPLNSGRNYHSHANYQGADYDGERGVLVLFDLFLNRERRDQHNDQKGDRKNYQADRNKYDSGLDNIPDLFEFDDHPQQRGDC